MWGWKKTIGLEVAIGCLLSMNGLSQGLSVREMIARHLVSKTYGFPVSRGNAGFSHDLDYSLTTNGLFLVNWLHENKPNQASFCQNLKYHCLLQNKGNIRITNTFVHNLGIQLFFDSTTKVNIDDNTLTTKVDIRVSGRYNFTFDSRITSRILNGFDHRINDSGDMVRILNSSFLTPLVCTFSTGISYDWYNTGFLKLGISAVKLTYILNRQIFGIRGVTTYYGVEEGKNHLFEYGVTFQVFIDKDILKMLHWNLDILLFKNYNAPVDMILKNLLGFRINRFLKTSLQTRILYEEKLSKHLQFENILSVGLNLQL